MEHDTIDQLIDQIRKILRDESPSELTALTDLFSKLPPKQKTDFMAAVILELINLRIKAASATLKKYLNSN